MTTATFSNVVRGVALGDAWGDKNEFQSILSITSKDPKGPGLPNRLRITDDTQMTLFLADALDFARANGSDEQATKDTIVKAFLDYYDDPDSGSRAPGVTVMGSLHRIAGGLDWQTGTNFNSDGSGTVMRTSPVAFVSEDRWVGVAAFAAAVTHGAANGIAAAILNVAILRDLIDGVVAPGELIERALLFASDPESFGLLDTGTWLDGYEVPDGLEGGFTELARLLGIAHDNLQRFRDDPWGGPKSDPSLLITSKANRGGGWRAHETLVIALLAVDTFPEDPINALRRSVTTDGDSDTIGAVAGALIGAAFPEVFIDLWEIVRDRFEPRYVAWIEEEADDYLFTADGLVKRVRSWLKKKVLG